MIRPDKKPGAQQVLLELPKEVNDGEEFLSGRTIIPLSLVKRTTSVGDHHFLPVLNLREDRPRLRSHSRPYSGCNALNPTA